MNRGTKIGLGISGGLAALGAIGLGVYEGVKYHKRRSNYIPEAEESKKESGSKRLGWRSKSREERKRLGWKPKKEKDISSMEEVTEEPKEEEPAESEAPNEDDEDEDEIGEKILKAEPREISSDEFDLSESEDYIKNYFTWYAKDQVLVDELDELVVDPERILGKEVIRKLEANEYRSNECFVCNDVLGTVYSITIEDMRFSDGPLSEE